MRKIVPCLAGDPNLEIKNTAGEVIGVMGKLVKDKRPDQCMMKEKVTFVTFPPQSKDLDKALLMCAGIWAGAGFLSTPGFKGVSLRWGILKINERYIIKLSLRLAFLHW